MVSATMTLYDIALIRLSEQLKKSNSLIEPICLPDDDVNFDSKSDCEISGKYLDSLCLTKLIIFQLKVGEIQKKVN